MSPPRRRSTASWRTASRSRVVRSASMRREPTAGRAGRLRLAVHVAGHASASTDSSRSTLGPYSRVDSRVDSRVRGHAHRLTSGSPHGARAHQDPGQSCDSDGGCAAIRPNSRRWLWCRTAFGGTGGPGVARQESQRTGRRMSGRRTSMAGGRCRGRAGSGCGRLAAPESGTGSRDCRSRSALEAVPPQEGPPPALGWRIHAGTLRHGGRAARPWEDRLSSLAPHPSTLVIPPVTRSQDARGPRRPDLGWGSPTAPPR